MEWARRILVAAVVLAGAGAAGAAELPTWLPRYDLDIDLDVAGSEARVREVVTWTNRSDQPAEELVFNAHAHYQIPPDQVGKLAKTVELLRVMPSQGLYFGGPVLEVQQATFVQQGTASLTHGPPPVGLKDPANQLDFHYQDDNPTALVVPLPRPVEPGESVTIELTFRMKLPNKWGRWGQWGGVTYMVQWLPVVAYRDGKGWQPTPFVPWHQPFLNESGIYTARVTLPSDHKVACSGVIKSSTDLGNDRKKLEIEARGFRDFALLASARYEEFTGSVAVPGRRSSEGEESEPGSEGPAQREVKLKVLAFPEHEHYAKFLLAVMEDAIKAYSRWFGAYPHEEFRIAESYFGWNGNECGGLVMIDERIFAAPHLAEPYIDYLVSHEICHQWWYNAVGTDGYRETWMDEALAVYFSHRLINQKAGKNNKLLQFPKVLDWLPNIKRENYRCYSLYGVFGRNEQTVTVQAMPDFGHVVNLFAMTYDKGSMIVGMIEERLGEAAFIDFMRIIFEKYCYRVLKVADFQRELEEYTGKDWGDFFRDWLYGAGLSDWCVEEVRVDGHKFCCWLPHVCGKSPCTVTVLLHQKGEIDEPTTLGFCLDDPETPTVRVPIIPQSDKLELEDPPAIIESLGGGRMRVEVRLPREPKQVLVDPDHVIVDRNPANNCWKPRPHVRLTPLMTSLDSTDLTNDYDRWNITVGPWVYFPPYDDPWYTRSTMIGARAELFRLQEFTGGVFTAYRTDYRDVVLGADGFWNHWPWPRTQVGFEAERRLGSVYHSDQHANRGVVYGRYVINYSSSLYLPPMQYVEAFATITDNFLPVSRRPAPGAERFEQLSMGGIHYSINYLTPYWDPEGGFQFDVTAGLGCAILGQHQGSQQISAQFAMVKKLPEWLGPLSSTRMAYRLFGAAALPDEGEFFALGGETRFRGYQLPDRQGSVVWVGSLEWRVPLLRDTHLDCLDHVVGVRNVSFAPFYDVGEAFVKARPVGGNIAHALGAGLRVDVAWFGFIERTVFRVDLAKTVNDDTPLQVWLGFMQPF